MPKRRRSSVLPCASAAVWDARLSRRIPWVQKKLADSSAALKIRKIPAQNTPAEGLRYSYRRMNSPASPSRDRAAARIVQIPCARMLRQTRPAENASEGAAVCSAGFRPESSSSNVTFRCSAKAGSKERSGAVSPRSHRLTDLSDICRDSANSFCVMPRALRRAAMRPPKRFISIAFLPIFYFQPNGYGFIVKDGGAKGQPPMRENLSKTENPSGNMNELLEMAGSG